jgi:O-antigen/teichoic acid export membrane protein
MKPGRLIARLGKDTLVYGLSSAIQKFIVFLLFPIYTRLLTKSDFGAQDLVVTSTALIGMLLVLGMDSGAMLFYYSADEAEKNRIRSSWLWTELLLALPVSALLWWGAVPVCTAVFNSPEISPIFRLGVLSIPLSQGVRAILLVMRLTFRTTRFVVLSVFGVLVQVLSAILLVGVWRMGVRGVFIAILAANAAQMLLGVAMCADSFRFGISSRWLKSMLRVGIPLVPAALSVWVLNYSNRYFLVRYGSLMDIGMLSVAVRISSILLFVLSAFETAWGPFAYSIAQDRELAGKTYSKALTCFLLISLTGAAVLSVFGREITLVLATASYAGSAVLIPLYCCSAVAWASAYIVGMGAGIAKRTYHNTVAVGIGAGLNIGLNFVFIPIWGIAGAAAATLIGNIVSLAYMYVAGQHYFRVSYETRRLSALTVATAVVIAMGLLIDRFELASLLQGLALKAAICALFGSSLLLFGVVDLQDLGAAWSLVQSKIGKRMAETRP